MARVRKGDHVQVMSGSHKGKQGKVLQVLVTKERVLIEKVNMIKKHTRPTQKSSQGGIVDKEGSIHLSNVLLMCASCKGPRRAGTKIGDGGRKLRVCKKCGNEFAQARN